GNPSAPVVVSLADSEEPLGLLIDVSDTGPEIGAALLPTLFQRRVRDRHHHGAPVGVGLGLYIVRRVMELRGGRAELAGSGPDTGPYTAPALLPTTFQGSVRVRHSHGAPVGMGLGLHVVRRGMELHGGRAELACNGPETVTMRLLVPASI